MAYLLIGIAVLAIILLLGHGFANANPARLARGVRLVGGMATLVVAALLLARGAAMYALPLATFGLWLLSGSQGVRDFGGRSSDGQTSKVVTDTLEMELDLETGEISGRVLRGPFEGRDIETLSPADIVAVWQDCGFSDPQSAQILEAYLDRRHPTWREDMAGGPGTGQGSGAGAGARSQSSGGSAGPMTVAEAYDILGLAPGATSEEITRAHKTMMLKVHPDRGGSTYLAAKINAAKELLLSQKR